MFKIRKNQLPKRLPQLALVSFIAACSEAPAKEFYFTDGFDSRVGGVGGNNPVILPFAAVAASELSQAESGFTVAAGNAGTPLIFTIGGSNSAALTFSDGVQVIQIFGGDDLTSTAGIYKLTTTLDQYNLAVSVPNINNNSDRTSDDYQKGRIFIFWDVADIVSEVIAAASTANPSNLRLEIKGGIKDDKVGSPAPKFSQISAKDDNYDMVIRSHLIDKATSSGIDNGTVNEGAIYILWDVADYAGATTTIDLGKLGTDDENATSGSLAIYGGKNAERIGLYEPEFLQLGGKADDQKYDMVIRSEWVDKNNGTVSNTGVIFILWDVVDYKAETLNKTIGLDYDLSGEATAGSLAIHGGKPNDRIGTYEPELLQIGGVAGDNKLDMVIRSELVDTPTASVNNRDINQGAIYVLWDVADYYSAKANKIIDLLVTNVTDPNYATSGLLTIYGKDSDANLGSDDNNVLYATDSNGNKALTNVDEGHAGDSGKDDIVFTDKGYTYVIFGDKISTTGTDGKVDSKTIDLATVHSSMATSAEDFFSYTFDGTLVDKVGYRFVGNKVDLATVQADFPKPTTPLSDADADLGVWDIA